MKQIALLIIALSIAGAGFMISSGLAQRAAALKSLCLFITGIKTEIEYSQENAADIFEKMSRIYSDDLPFVAECGEKLQNGESFDKAWAESLSCVHNTCSLKQEDTALLESFGRMFGTTDVNGQITNCEMHIQLMEANLQNAENEMKLYRRPAAAIGTLAGAAIYILLM